MPLFWKEMRAMRQLHRGLFRPTVESLEDRRTPSAHTGGIVTGIGGVVRVTPPAAQGSPHAIDMHQQVAGVTPPGGAVVPGHGLKTAEAHTPVVDWTPT